MANEPSNASRPGRSASLGRGLFTLAFVLLIFWGFAFFALRTVSGHDFVVGRLAQALQMNVTVGQVTLRPPLSLRLRDVRSEDFASEQSGFYAEEIRIRPAGRARLLITMLRPELNLAFDGATWFPTNFAALGDLPFRDLGALSSACAGWREHKGLVVAGGQVFWHGQPDGLIASVRGLNFQIEPVAMPGQTAAYYHRLEAAAAVEPAGRQTDNVKVEWLAVGESRYVPIARGPTLPVGADAGFWGAADEKSNVH